MYVRVLCCVVCCVVCVVWCVFTSLSSPQALISAQKSFRQLVPGFTFNLGYCGYYFRHGQKDEVAGDELLLANADKFWWFGHTYHHIQPHLVSPDDLRTMMEKNLAFAKVG